MAFTLPSLLGLGLVLGVKHALDADHLAAVSTIAADRRSLLSASVVGAWWGVGHTLALLAAGVAVIGLRLEIGVRTAQVLELGVAVMLIGLGAQALWTLARGLRQGRRVHVHVHQHGPRIHVHAHAHGPEDVPHDQPRATQHHGIAQGARPLLVGMMHGLAGSASVMLFVLSTIPSPALGFAYLGVFGFGSLGGMVLMSALVSLPAQLAARQFVGAHLAVRGVAGVASVACGLVMVSTSAARWPGSAQPAAGRAGPNNLDGNQPLVITSVSTSLRRLIHD